MLIYQVFNTAQAQNPPENGRAIQRTIIDEQDMVPIDPNPAQTQASYTVFYALGAVVLIIIAIGLSMAVWGQQKAGKASGNPQPK